MSSHVLRGGIIIDGTGDRAFLGDVILGGGRIAGVHRRADLGTGESVLDAAKRMEEMPCTDDSRGSDLPGDVELIIDATGLVVTPGFIDIHTHSDLSILAAPDASAKILQGVTTDVIGNCSIGPAPLNPAGHEYFTGWRRYESSWLERAGVQWPVWPRWSQYSEVLAGTKKSINVAGLVGHGALRASAVGGGEAVANDLQMEEMKMLLEEAMEAGAFGMSTGLTYAPSCWAETGEIVELARVVSRYGGLYASHIRGEDERLLGAVDEAIRIGREAGASVQIAHHKAVGRPNWGRVHESLHLIRDALRSGVDVAVDMYPYCFSGTFPGALWSVLSSGVTDVVRRSGADGFSRREAVSEVRAWLRRKGGFAAKTEETGAESPQLAWDEIYIVEHPNADCVGWTAAQAAEEAGMRCADWFVANLFDEQIRVKRIMVSEADLRTVLAAPECSIGSDTYAMNDSEVFAGTWLHPRNFGAFARVLGKYVREEGVLDWEEAVSKMSGQPALRLGISDRGLVEEGRWADLAVWSPVRIEERASIDSPFTYAAGVQWVFVNGSPVVADGAVTDRRPGALICRR
ncbi:MAG: D-aminoacylase [Bacillota bacterium]